MTGLPSGLRVLLVEDELLIAQMLRSMLEDLGCVVVGPAARVNEALDLIAAEPVDAAVLDVCLNRQFSYPVATELMKRDVPFLFSTGYQPERLRPEHQATAILQKPYSAAELERALTVLLSGRGEVRPRRAGAR